MSGMSLYTSFVYGQVNKSLERHSLETIKNYFQNNKLKHDICLQENDSPLIELTDLQLLEEEVDDYLIYSGKINTFGTGSLPIKVMYAYNDNDELAFHTHTKIDQFNLASLLPVLKDTIVDKQFTFSSTPLIVELTNTIDEDSLLFPGLNLKVEIDLNSTASKVQEIKNMKDWLSINANYLTLSSNIGFFPIGKTLDLSCMTFGAKLSGDSAESGDSALDVPLVKINDHFSVKDILAFITILKQENSTDWSLKLKANMIANNLAQGADDLECSAALTISKEKLAIVGTSYVWFNAFGIKGLNLDETMLECELEKVENSWGNFSISFYTGFTFSKKNVTVSLAGEFHTQDKSFELVAAFENFKFSEVKDLIQQLIDGSKDDNESNNNEVIQYDSTTEEHASVADFEPKSLVISSQRGFSIKGTFKLYDFTIEDAFVSISKDGFVVEGKTIFPDWIGSLTNNLISVKGDIVFHFSYIKKALDLYVKGEFKINQVEADFYFKYYKQDKEWQSIVSADVKNIGFTLSDLIDACKGTFFDKFVLQEMGFLISKVSLPEDKVNELTSNRMKYSVDSGFTFYAKVDVVNSKSDMLANTNVLSKDSSPAGMTMAVNIGKSSTFKLFMDAARNIDLGKNVKCDDFHIELGTGGSQGPYFKLVFGLKISVTGNQTIFFKASLLLEAEDAIAEAYMSSDNWTNCFGIKGFSIKKLGLMLEINYAQFISTGLPSALGFTGELSFGEINVGLTAILGDDPSKELVHGKIENLTMRNVVKALDEMFDIHIPEDGLPLDKIALYVLELYACSANLQFAGKSYEPGFRFRGGLKFFDLEGYVSVKISQQDGFRLFGTMKELVLGPITITCYDADPKSKLILRKMIAVALEQDGVSQVFKDLVEHPGPTVDILIPANFNASNVVKPKDMLKDIIAKSKSQPQEQDADSVVAMLTDSPHVMVSGKVDLFGINAQAFLLFSTQMVDMRFELNILNELIITFMSSANFSDFKWDFTAEIDNHLQDYIADQITKGIEAGLEVVKKKGDETAKYLDDLSKQYNEKRAIAQAQQDMKNNSEMEKLNIKEKELLDSYQYTKDLIAQSDKTLQSLYDNLYNVHRNIDNDIEKVSKNLEESISQAIKVYKDSTLFIDTSLKNALQITESTQQKFQQIISKIGMDIQQYHKDTEESKKKLKEQQEMYEKDISNSKSIHSKKNVKKLLKKALHFEKQCVSISKEVISKSEKAQDKLLKKMTEINDRCNNDKEMITMAITNNQKKMDSIDNLSKELGKTVQMMKDLKGEVDGRIDNVQKLVLQFKENVDKTLNEVCNVNEHCIEVIHHAKEMLVIHSDFADLLLREAENGIEALCLKIASLAVEVGTDFVVGLGKLAEKLITFVIKDVFNIRKLRIEGHFSTTQLEFELEISGTIIGIDFDFTIDLNLSNVLEAIKAIIEKIVKLF